MRVERPRRVAYLDDVRVFLTVLVILHHVAASYAGPGTWYYSEPVSGPGSLLALTFLMAINQAFFMGFFFLLAGYFVPPALGRKGPRAFLRDRAVRLGIPLVVYVLAINPFVCWLAGGPSWQLGPGPMWFVEVLLLLTLAWVIVAPVAPALPTVRVDAASTTALAAAMGVASFLIRIRHPVNEWLAFPTIQPAHATQYVCLFAIGIRVAGSDLAAGLTPGLLRYWRGAMLLATGVVLVAFVSADVPGDGRTTLEPLVGGATWQSLVVALWEQVVAVGLITNLLALFAARSRPPGPIASAAAAAAYTVYIVHPIVLVALARALRDVALPSFAKFSLTAPIAVLVLFAGAHWLRRAPLLRRAL